MSACTKYFNGLVLPRDRFETVGSKLNLLKCSSNATTQAIAYSKLDMSHAKKKIVNESKMPKDKIYVGYQKSTQIRWIIRCYL